MFVYVCVYTRVCARRPCVSFASRWEIHTSIKKKSFCGGGDSVWGTLKNGFRPPACSHSSWLIETCVVSETSRARHKARAEQVMASMLWGTMCRHLSMEAFFILPKTSDNGLPHRANAARRRQTLHLTSGEQICGVHSFLSLVLRRPSRTAKSC